MAVSFKKFIDLFVPQGLTRLEEAKEKRIVYGIRIGWLVPVATNYTPLPNESKWRAYEFKRRIGKMTRTLDFESAQRFIASTRASKKKAGLYDPPVFKGH